MTSWGKIQWDSVLAHIPKGICIHSLDMQEIMPNYAFETTKKLGIYKELERHLFEGLINAGDLYGVLPLTLYANEKDIGKVTTKENFDLSSVQSKESVAIIITTCQLHTGFVNCHKY